MYFKATEEIVRRRRKTVGLSDGFGTVMDMIERR
jgi:hypothetical protein